MAEYLVSFRTAHGEMNSLTGYYRAKSADAAIRKMLRESGGDVARDGDDDIVDAERGYWVAESKSEIKESLRRRAEYEARTGRR